MLRDGFNESIWQSGLDAFQAKEAAINSDGYDVLIVGGGITGVATALMMQQAGLSCVLVEAKTLCFGTTGGTTAHLNNFFDSTYAQFETSFGIEKTQLIASAANEALALYRRNIYEHKIDCNYQENNGCLYALDDAQARKLDEVLDASRRAGIAVRPSSESPLPIPFTRSIIYERQAQLHPVKYVYGLATAFETSGGIILQHCRVTGLKKTDNPSWLGIETNLGSITAKNVVYATHIPPGFNWLDFKCSPWRSYAIACTLKDGKYPDPAYDMADPYHYYRTQRMSGVDYLVAGGEDHRTGKEEDTEMPFIRLENYLSQYFEIGEVCKKWSSQYFDPADGLAYIGHLPGGSENVFVACGFAGNGMTYSHIAAPLLTALIKKEKPVIASLFSPTRVKPVAALGNELAAGVSVATSFIGDRLKIKKIVDESELNRGEGKIIKYEGENLAVFHDEHGKFHTVSPVCTHLKCLVQWNQTERSWDCPCHGARYNTDGEMITGPADHDLPQHRPVF